MISLNGKIENIFNDETSSHLMIKIPKFQSIWLSNLDKEKEYKIEIKEIKSKKSLMQNNYVWGLLTEIAKELDIIPDSYSLYLQLLHLAQIKTVFVETIPEAEQSLKQGFRVVVERERRISVKGVETVLYECGWGLSKFTKEETSRFIDCLLEYAEMNNVDTSY